MPACIIGSKEVCKPGECGEKKKQGTGQESRDNGSDEAFGENKPPKD